MENIELRRVDAFMERACHALRNVDGIMIEDGESSVAQYLSECWEQLKREAREEKGGSDGTH